jgi:hypothetical protein
MRLTLRTMLAYLDEVLEPADAEALGKKIEESDFASGLVQRIKGVMKKVRIDAPKVDGKGMGNDANTVSEYLDSSLPQDRVGDFERVCLESDKHLCEVASCHQVLTLVLGKPADVPDGLRERVYALVDPERVSKVEEFAARSDGRPQPPPVAKSNGQAAVVHAAPEVPEYLRAGRRPVILPLLAAGIAALALLLLAFWLLGGPTGLVAMAQRMRGSSQVAINSSNTAPTTTKPAESPSLENDQPSVATSRETSSRETSSPSATSSAETTTNEPPPMPRPSVPDMVTAPEPATGVATANAIESITPRAPMPLAPPTAEAPAEETRTARATVITKLPPAVAKAEPKPALIEVGRFTSDGEVLATLDPDTGLWRRKPTLSVLAAGERLTVLPPYRAQVALPSGVQVTFAGEGAVRMERPGERGISRMTVDYGRFLVVTVGAAGAQIELDLIGVKGVATLVDADSSLAIRAEHWLPPGTDPEAVIGLPVVELFNTGGRVTWQPEGGQKAEIAPHFVLTYLGTEPPELQGPYMAPEWIDKKSVAPIDRQASLALESALDPSKPLNLSLQEATQERRVEVRALSARCLSVLNEFEPVLRELSDSRQYSFWVGEIESLKHALSRGPETAAQVRAAAERLRGSESKDIYRLLWGYSPEQLEKGAAAQLVRFLEHDQMDIRVLTFYNLGAITGAQEFYRPERPPAQMRAPIQNWQNRLAKGTIAYKVLPLPVEIYRPLPGAAGASAVEPRPAAPARPMTPPAFAPSPSP